LLGEEDGVPDGSFEGIVEGAWERVGILLGWILSLGFVEGLKLLDGERLGDSVGTEEGTLDGEDEGTMLGRVDGPEEGVADGLVDGKEEGVEDGNVDGVSLGIPL
jgi:hypothetical protein